MPQTPNFREIKTLLVGVRENGQPRKSRTGIKFSGDDLEGDTPLHITALDRLAHWIVSRWDDSGPDIETWKERATLQ